MKTIQTLIFMSVIRNGSNKSKPEEQVDENPQTSETKIEFPKAKPFNSLQELMNNIKEEYNINSEYESDEIQNEEGFGYLPPTNLLYYRSMDDLPSHKQTINSEMQNKNIQEKSQNIPIDEEHKNDSQDVTNEPHNNIVEDVKDSSIDKNPINNNHQLQNQKFKVSSDKKQFSGSKAKRNTRPRLAMTDSDNQLYPKKLLQNRDRPIVKKTSFFRKKINELKAKKFNQKNPQKRYKRTKGAEIKDLRRKKKPKNDKLKKSKKSPKFKSKDNTLEHTPSMIDLTQGDDPNAYLTIHESENIRPIEDFKIDNDKSPKIKAEIDGAESKLKGVKSKAVRDELYDKDDLKDINNKTHRVVDSIQHTKSQIPLDIVHNVKPHNIIKLTFSFGKTKS
ncbi:hypothetical protein NBO_10g0095 [Nosema bombycis CQ1]|uniref:Uncharacterized protein n=1 Tax=Nosema bombycis (strain CQ1 / CVCC 102059) TaxID=578461 RepID=R0MLI2_NOSB1|nr:hypothetical protein NBO_10g0095 [Nosema bombycis CQ1]|eukprot:EOB15105.1 hypothetical protein NBO_10g0095 [Nosema bombycis CQ1]